MKRLILSFVIALMALGAAPALAQKGADPAGDSIMGFAADDVEMNAAIEAARSTFPQFLAAFGRAPATERQYFMVKLGLTDGDGELEHIWVESLYFDGDQLMGHLANVPVHLPNMQQGSPVEVRSEQISDWSITRADGMYGNFTTRVMLERMPAQEAAPYRAAVSATPIPADWRI